MSCHGLDRGVKIASNVSQGVASCARSFGHVTCATTATVAHLLGCAALTVGPAAAGFFAYDSYQWNQNTPPIWAKITNHMDKELPLLARQMQSCVSRNGDLICTSYHTPVEQAIAVGVVTSLALAVATPLVAYSCFQISKLVTQLDQDLFKKVD